MRITEHQAAYELQRLQLKLGFIGLSLGGIRTADNFLPTQRNLLGGVAHTANLVAHHIALALEGKKRMRSIHGNQITRRGN